MYHIDFIGGFFEEIWTGVEKKTYSSDEMVEV